MLLKRCNLDKSTLLETNFNAADKKINEVSSSLLGILIYYDLHDKINSFIHLKKKQ